jgi:hypothetical protein
MGKDPKLMMLDFYKLVSLFLIVTRSISAAVLVLSVIIIFLKIQSTVEITKCLTIPKHFFSILTMAILSLFILSLGPSLEHLQLPNTCFSMESAF